METVAVTAGITRYDDRFNCRHLTVLDLESGNEEVLDAEVRAAADAKIHVITMKFVPALGQIIPVAQKVGFEMHHGDKKEIQMTRCLVDHGDRLCSFPAYKTLSVGITMVVFNSELNKIAAVVEKLGSSQGWKAITGSVDYGEGLSETPLKAAVREAQEEVGLEVDPRTVVYCGRLWTSNFRGSCPDLNEIFATVVLEECDLRAEEAEINAAKWISIDEIISVNPESVGSLAILAAKNAILGGSAYKARDAYWGWDKAHAKPIEFLSQE